MCVCVFVVMYMCVCMSVFVIIKLCVRICNVWLCVSG